MVLIRRIVNFTLLIISFTWSIISKRITHFGMPLGISVEPNNYCNLHCKECVVGQALLMRKKTNMPLQMYNQIINELYPYIINIIIYFQGEPFLSSNIFEMISCANNKKVYSIVSTNGHYLTEKNVYNILQSGLKRIIISLDGTTQDVYEKYRIGGSLKKVLKGTQLVITEKKKQQLKFPEIIFQFLLTAENEHQVKDAKKLAKNLNVDKIKFKTAQIDDFENGNPLIPKNEKFSRYKKGKDGKYKIKSKLKNYCWRMWTHPVITSSGVVVPCCFDKNAKYKMGNINNNSFKEIWNSENYKNFREKVFKDRKSIDICKNCTEGLFNVFV